MTCDKCKKKTGILYLSGFSYVGKIKLGKTFICETCEFADELQKKVEKQVKKKKKK